MVKYGGRCRGFQSYFTGTNMQAHTFLEISSLNTFGNCFSNFY